MKDGPYTKQRALMLRQLMRDCGVTFVDGNSGRDVLMNPEPLPSVRALWESIARFIETRPGTDGAGVLAFAEPCEVAADDDAAAERTASQEAAEGLWHSNMRAAVRTNDPDAQDALFRTCAFLEVEYLTHRPDMVTAREAIEEVLDPSQGERKGGV